MLNVEINRKTWGRGSRTDSFLLNSDTKMKCCLGFAMLAAGATECEISNVTIPAYVQYKNKRIRHIQFYI